eukprot:PhF_6_TR20860/c0_g1_i2/m.30071
MKAQQNLRRRRRRRPFQGHSSTLPFFLKIRCHFKCSASMKAQKNLRRRRRRPFQGHSSNLPFFLKVRCASKKPQKKLRRRRRRRRRPFQGHSYAVNKTPNIVTIMLEVCKSRIW